MKAWFQKLFEHEHWANLQVLEASQQAIDIPVRAHEILSHIVAAQQIWIARIKGQRTSTKVWELYPIEALKELLDTNYDALGELLKTEDFGRQIHYRNSTGKEFNSTVGDILTHLALHASYHRGQVVLLIKGQVSPLPMTDYIFYNR